MKERLVETKDKDGNDIKLYVVSPGRKALHEAHLEYNKALREAVESGAYLRKQLYKKLEEDGVWTKQDQEKEKKVLDEIKALEHKIRSGGMTKKDLKDLAVEIKRKRAEFRLLIAEKNEQDLLTAESQAENSRFYSIIVNCVLDENKKRVFSSIEDYDSKADEEWAIAAVESLAELLYNIDPNYEESYVEHRFLKKLNLIDEEGWFVDNDGNRIDMEGRLVDENGHYYKMVDGEKVRINKDGRPIDENGDYLDAEPFFDEDGNPIYIFEEEKKEEKPTKKRGRPKKTE